MLVTTAYDPSERHVLQSQNFADQLGAKWVPRGHDTLPKLRRKYREKEIMVVAEELKYYLPEQPPLFFHPGVAYIRMKRLLLGEGDPLLTIAGVQPGDSVLDCTAGLGGDSIVFAFAAGPTGRVTALESEEAVYWIAKEGLAHYHTEIPEFNDAMRRIKLLHTDHLAYLKEQADHSVDIVFFDPMFRDTVQESANMDPLRSSANTRSIREEAIHEARRVARKAIVLKENVTSHEFSRLGFSKHRSHAKFAYGVIQL